MKRTSFLIATIGALVLGSCGASENATATATKQAYENIEVNGKIYAAVFQQRAAEYKALCQQAFNIAQLRVDQLNTQKHSKPMALVTDVDETFVDNSPYAVEMAKQGKVFDAPTWSAWTAKANAIPLHGSQAFYNYAQKNNVEVFYITNRGVKDKEATIENLKKFGFPNADAAHVIVKTAESSKEARRLKLSETHEIVMLLGDNLSDFSKAFDSKTEAERTTAVKDNAAAFGNKFIVLPNTGYGDWESALFQYKKDLTTKQKDSIYINSVIGF